MHSVFCDLGNSIKSQGNWSAVEIADTLVFMGNVNAADSVVDFGKDDPTGEGDDLMSTMEAYRGMGMSTKVREGIIVILGAKAEHAQTLRRPLRRRDRPGVHHPQQPLHAAWERRAQEPAAAAGAHRRVRDPGRDGEGEAPARQRDHAPETLRLSTRDQRVEGRGEGYNATVEGDTKSIPRIGPAPPPDSLKRDAAESGAAPAAVSTH